MDVMTRARTRAQRESGFTLIELLIVIVIVGILAAIAIPSFVGQRGKASDASAKVQARTLQTAIEAVASDESGKYTAGSIERLKEIEPTLKDESQAAPSVELHTETEYAVASEDKATKVVFKVKRSSGGIITRECTPEKVGACAAGGNW
jgi:type IV pilus assembly protein PilA